MRKPRVVEVETPHEVGVQAKVPSSVPQDKTPFASVSRVLQLAREAKAGIPLALMLKALLVEVAKVDGLDVAR